MYLYVIGLHDDISRLKDKVDRLERQDRTIDDRLRKLESKIK